MRKHSSKLITRLGFFIFVLCTSAVMANAQTNIFQPTATVGGFSSGSKIPIDKLKAKKALSIYIKI